MKVNTDFLYWISEAVTVFLNGTLAGWPQGGVGGGIIIGTTHDENAAWISGLVIAATNGGKRVLVWHDSHPFPNPFPRPPS